ncbi:MULTISPECIES: methyltransferase family protein [Chryseobacterium]|uniref:methyltransferase family protein n=1 Tax=Chryseobacterium TaxID=59732 RepID=UPI00195D41B5|nr:MULTISPECIES: isoprenylcysteine carboxylmethyltransferase family protein [Chryseobacterium]MBM7420026.1 protein-S-isoprenylcysteine O-methyltransferase Ste14 [Chryseobacterium sp. JUb44]MDH6209964.1 protein-S-isoprenylcysteine O-methyltransferase Ste14 [Chryseobacterium sp. BIGb0186]WSO08697.1 isoprenylcysteine carboxylmethyltransferase family protein [Chryseobacterium scophthalmum]
MTDFIRVFIPLFFIIFFMTAFFGTSFIVSKRIEKNPNVLPKDDSAYGLIGIYFKYTLLFIFIYTVLLFIFPEDISSSFKINLPKEIIFKYIGIALLILSLIWILIAQFQMKNSWRIGIDEDLKTELITTGLFNYSRNPIFLGILVSLIGLFFTLPTLVSLSFFLISYILIQTQIRLEEEFLLNQHDKIYLRYKGKVRRFL